MLLSTATAAAFLIHCVLQGTPCASASSLPPYYPSATQRQLQDPFDLQLELQQESPPLLQEQHVVHCLPAHSRRTSPLVGPVLQECHAIVSDMTQPMGSVCAEIGPGLHPDNPELRLTLMALRNMNAMEDTWTFVEHHVWVGNSVRDIPRNWEGTMMDTTQFTRSWSNYTHGAKEWQAQIPLDCHDAKEHTFRVVVSSLATTSSALVLLSNSTRMTAANQFITEQQCYAMEYDGQAGGEWFGWMEITVDCHCTVASEGDDHYEEYDHEVPWQALHANTTNATDFYPYGRECQGPDLFRLLASPEMDPPCWDILDTVLLSPISRLCVDITAQDTEQTELTVTFTAFDLLELTQTSLWTGVRPGDTIHSVPRRPQDNRQLYVEAFDHFLADPKGLPNTVSFEFQLPTHLCSSSGHADEHASHTLGRKMSDDGIISIPMVAQVFTKPTTPDDSIIPDGDDGYILGGYSYQYRYVNDNVEFGWMELQLQCGCSQPQEKKILRQDRPVAAAAQEETSDPPPPPPSPPSIADKICHRAFAYASSIETVDSVHPLKSFGYDLEGYTNGPFPASYSSIVLDLVATMDGSSQQQLEVEPRLVGTVNVFFDGEDADVTFALNEPFSLKETFLYAGKHALPPYNPKADLTSENRSAASTFDFAYHHDEGTFVDADVLDSYTVEGFDYGDTIYVLAIADYCRDLSVSSDGEDEDVTPSTKVNMTDDACLRAESSCYRLTARDHAETQVGKVCFSLDMTQEYLNVVYSVSEGSTLSEAHLFVGPTLQTMPTLPDKSPDLKNFEYQRHWSTQSQNWTTQVPLGRKERCDGSNHVDFEVVVVAHALVGRACGSDDNCDSSPVVEGSELNVYAEETLLQKEDTWFHYLGMTVDCHCEDGEATDNDSPTMIVSAIPTAIPSFGPTANIAPSASPSNVPTKPNSSRGPTQAPTRLIDMNPTSSIAPSASPSNVPTKPNSSRGPTQAPTRLIDMKNTCIYAEDGSGEYCLLLYAPQAWETVAGSVCLTMVEGELVVIYDVVSTWSLAEANVWIGTDLFDLPINSDQEPDTKSFPFRQSWPQGTGHYTEVIPMNATTQDQCQTVGAYSLYIVAHGLVAEPAVSPTLQEPFVPYSEEDAFAKAYEFDDMPSAYYVLASVICDCAAFDDNDNGGEENRRLLLELKAPTSTRPPVVPIEAQLTSIAPGYVNAPSKSPAMILDPEPSAESESESSLPRSSRDSRQGEDSLLPATNLVPPSSQAATLPVLEPLCQDAWAVDENPAKTVCFPQVNSNYTYGWSNGPLDLKSGILILDLFLGTGDCGHQGIRVGSVWVSWEQSAAEVAIDFKIDDDYYYLDQTHVSTGEHPLYRKDSTDPILDPAGFPWQHNNLPLQSSEDTHTVKVAASTYEKEFSSLPLLETLQYLSARATVCTASTNTKTNAFVGSQDHPVTRESHDSAHGMLMNPKSR